MKIIRELPNIAISNIPSVLTIGNFDGMHLGHQAVLKRLIAKSRENHCPSVVLSFENHPAEVVRPHTQICKICTPQHKIRLMEELGIDILILLTFTKEFSEQSAEEFLKKMQKVIPFSHLILGWDATLGKNRHGCKELVQAIAKKENFNVDYLPQEKIDGKPVSSSFIRQLIQEGKFDEVKKFLGRPYSIYSSVYKGDNRGKKLGFPTANLNIKQLCLPPLGVYAVTSIVKNQSFKGVANLGIAPTLRQDHIPVLEVHIFDFEENLYETFIEVIFTQFIRSEKKFNSVEELKLQIQQDIFKANTIE